MDSKLVILSLGTDLLLLFVSMYFIYYGIDTQQYILSVIFAFMMIVGIVRLVIFAKTFKKRGKE